MKPRSCAPAPPSRKIEGPVYQLAPLRFDLSVIDKNKAARMVVERLGLAMPAAEAFIRQSLTNLDPGMYKDSFEVEWDVQGTKRTLALDEYGYRDDDALDWYTKFYLSNGRVTVVSFHEPEWDFVCRNGVTMNGWRR